MVSTLSLTYTNIHRVYHGEHGMAHWHAPASCSILISQTKTHAQILNSPVVSVVDDSVSRSLYDTTLTDVGELAKTGLRLVLVTLTSLKVTAATRTVALSRLLAPVRPLVVV